MQAQKPQVLISAETLAARVRELGAQIAADYHNKELVVVGVLKASFVFAADLIRAIDAPLTLDFLGVRSYGDSTETSGVVQITSDLTHSVEGKDVLLVEDIVDTGLTLRFLLDNLATRAPQSVRLAALLHKPARTRAAVRIDYLGFPIDDVFVVGYGLDHAQRYRNLPYVGVLPPEENSVNKRLERLEQLIAKGTHDPFVRYARALELRGAGELERALEALSEVRALHPDYVPTFLMAGQIAQELERGDDARAWLSAGVELATRVRDEHARSELQSALDAL